MLITNADDLLKLENNKFYGVLPNLVNSSIRFAGKNNILICEGNVNLKDSNIIFHSSNSILYLSSSRHDYSVNISINKNNVCFIGKNNFFNGKTTIVASEAKNIIIGDGCLFSYNVILRVADAHLIYSTKTQKRLNHSKSIYIGDHIWFGQNVMIFKGTQIGSGSIIGAGSVLSNKIVPSNVTFAGNPARLTKKDTFWMSQSTHGWDEKETKKMNSNKSKDFTYNFDESTINFKDIEEKLNKFSDAEDVLKYIKDVLAVQSKNRFYINVDPIQANKKKSLFKDLF